MSKLFHPPNIELENYSGYRENYYRAINSGERPFNKSMGYFSYFVEKTRREKEMKDIYTKKNLFKQVEKFKGKHWLNNGVVVSNSKWGSLITKENQRYGRTFYNDNKNMKESNPLRFTINPSSNEFKISVKQRKKSNQM